MLEKNHTLEKSKAETKNILKESSFSAKRLILWLVIGGAIGVIVGAIGALFGNILVRANDFREQNPWIILFLPVAGIVIVFLYRFFKNADDSGTNMVISSIHSSTGIPFRMAPLIFITTILTHLCGGSAGREGAAIQLGGSIANRIGKIIKLNQNDQHIIVMCGMSAAFSALFGTPMAAAIFSLEVISIGIMHYSALVPCVTASMIAHFIAVYFGIAPESFAVTQIPSFTPGLFFEFVLFGGLVGLVSIGFCVTLHGAEYIYKRHLKNPYIRIAVAGCVIVLLTALLGTDKYLGSGMTMIEHIFHAEDVRIYDFILKIVFTALTLGAGFKGGEIVPSFCIGAAFGCAVASLFGLPVTLVAACGMVGLFCGVTNCPITSLLISFELFGFEGMPYYLTTIAVSYMLSGYYGLYHAQKIMYSKTETNFVNKAAR
ncbi:MAG: chloride channel protein [Lachnospiraceae bacterium]|nr:chloride channel protein [Lachnospiraceae bacterium]